MGLKLPIGLILEFQRDLLAIAFSVAALLHFSCLFKINFPTGQDFNELMPARSRISGIKSSRFTAIK